MFFYPAMLNVLFCVHISINFDKIANTTGWPWQSRHRALKIALDTQRYCFLTSARVSTDSTTEMETPF